MDNLVANENIIVYSDGELELKVSVNEETVWLNRQQISSLFDRDVKTIGKHVNNVFADGELIKEVVVAKFATTTQHGAIKGKTQTKLVEYYNLDVVISVGYRVKSQKGVAFRQLATKILKQYITNGYSINSHKITHQRFKELESEVDILKSKVSKIDALVENNTLEIKQGIFYEGEIFDAYVFANSLLLDAKKEIVLVDNYIDETVLVLFSKYPSIKFTIYSKTISKQLKLDVEKYNKQYNGLEIKIINKFHDRFLIIDGKKAYHIGASLKDLAKKTFAFSVIDVDLLIGKL